jgi:hypothetical protein
MSNSTSRRPERKAVVLIRMSPEQRLELTAAAADRGQRVHDVMLRFVDEYVFRQADPVMHD